MEIRPRVLKNAKILVIDEGEVRALSPAIGATGARRWPNIMMNRDIACHEQRWVNHPFAPTRLSPITAGFAEIGRQTIWSRGRRAHTAMLYPMQLLERRKEDGAQAIAPVGCRHDPSYGLRRSTARTIVGATIT